MSAVNKQATSDALLQLLTTLVQELKESVSGRLNQVLEKLEKYQDDHKELQNTVENLKNELHTQKQELTALKQHYQQNNKPLPAAIKQNHTPTTDTHTIDRGIKRNNLIITGIDIGSTDPLIFIQAFISARFSTRSDCILAVQKIGSNARNQTAAQEQTPRYLITMKSYWDAQIIYNRRLQVLRNENIYISEDLSIAESKLFFKARQLKKTQLIYTTWTKEGRIYIRRTSSSDPEELKEDHPLLNTTTKTAVKSVEPIAQTNPKKSTSTSQQTNQEECATKYSLENTITSSTNHTEIDPQKPTITTSDPAFTSRQKREEIKKRITRQKAHNFKIQ